MALTLKLVRSDQQHDPTDHSVIGGKVHFSFWPTPTPSASMKGQVDYTGDLTATQRVALLKDYIQNNGDFSGETAFGNEWDSETWNN